MAERIFNVQTNFEQIQAFCRLAEKYKSDFNLPELKHFQTQDMKKTFQWVVDHYQREVGEQIFRPKLYFELTKTGKGSDCDDGFIWWASLMRSVSLPASEIFVVEAKENADDEDYVHIFAAVKNPKTGKMIWLDNLPGCEFGKLDYESDRVKISTMAEYL